MLPPRSAASESFSELGPESKDELAVTSASTEETCVNMRSNALTSLYASRERSLRRLPCCCCCCVVPWSPKTPRPDTRYVSITFMQCPQSTDALLGARKQACASTNSSVSFRESRET